MKAIPAASGTATSYDGARVSYRDFGGEGSALVMFPGWACVQAMWDPVIPHLRNYRVVTLDYAGFGTSGAASPRQWTMENFARDVRAVLHKLELRDVTLVGHSMGGAVALEAAYLCTDRVAQVIGTDTYTYATLYPHQDERVLDEILAPFTIDFAGTVRALIALYLRKDGDPALSAYVSDTMAAATPSCAIPAMEQLLRWDLDASLARCPVPVFAINARPFLDATAIDRFTGRIAIKTIDDVGHFLMMERPADYAAALAGCLEASPEATPGKEIA